MLQIIDSDYILDKEDEDNFLESINGSSYEKMIFTVGSKIFKDDILLKSYIDECVEKRFFPWVCVFVEIKDKEI